MSLTPDEHALIRQVVRMFNNQKYWTEEALTDRVNQRFYKDYGYFPKGTTFSRDSGCARVQITDDRNPVTYEWNGKRLRKVATPDE